MPVREGRVLFGWLLFLLGTTITNASTCDAPRDGYDYLGEREDHHYFLSNEIFNHAQAVTKAQEQGGYMVAVTSSAENEFLRSKLTAIVRIGLSDISTEGDLIWENGESFAFSNFQNAGSNSPSNDVANMNFWHGTWQMEHPVIERRFVLEVPCTTVPVVVSDLVASGISIADTLTPNGPLNFGFKIRNEGPDDLAANTPISVQLRLSDPRQPTKRPVLIFEREFALSLASGFGTKFRVTDAQMPGNLFFAPGHYQLSLHVDANNVVSEPNEQNNIFVRKVELAPEILPVCRSGLRGHRLLGKSDGRTYFLSKEATNWERGARVANQVEGYLASISSETENAYLDQLINTTVYIGFNDSKSEGEFQWASGEHITFLNLNTSNNDESDYGTFNGAAGGTWGLDAAQQTRRYVIEIPCNTPPVISLNGPAELVLEFGDDFLDPGASAIDEEDGKLTADIVVSGFVNTLVPGYYDVVYQVEDSRGLLAEAIRTVRVLKARPLSRTDAFRFIQRTGFGPTPEEIDSLLSKGYGDWLTDQFNQSPTWRLPGLRARMADVGYDIDDVTPPNRVRLSQYMSQDTWFDTIINREDQLRQRVAFALSQILVVSYRNDALYARPQGVASYYDLLIQHAFGNYRSLLGDVSRHPIMGIYLSTRRNEKGNAAQNILPDENYARELMQLFSIGLEMLNLDGTVQLDENGSIIPTYTQDDIRNMARVFTGWNYGDAPALRTNARTIDSEKIPMRAFEEYHDTAPKTVLGITIPGGQTAAQDMDAALDAVFSHPNVGPFVAKQLIQKLVTSNPTPDYVARVASVFNNNGFNVRGDMKSTVRAVLMDPEALLGHRDDAYVFGKVKEPLLKLTALWRAFNADGHVPGRIRFSDTYPTILQENLRAPSVFNFFQPSYSLPGTISDAQLVSPEFQILNDSSSILLHNELAFAAVSTPNRGGSFTVGKNSIYLDIEFAKTLANDANALADHISELLLGGDMSSDLRNIVMQFIESRPTTDGGTQRVHGAIFLVLLSPAYAVQK